MQHYQSTTYTQDQLQISKMLRNTYSLLSLILVAAAVSAYLSMTLITNPIVAIVLSLVSIGLIFVVQRTANSASGLFFAMLVAVTMGASIGPLLNFYANMPQGASIITQAFGGTALIFFGLSGFVLSSKKDFSFMRNFLFVGLMVALIASIANIFFDIPALSLAISAAMVLIMSGYILHDTSAIVRGEYDNYIMAAVSLFINIFSLFVHLLRLLAAFNSDD